MAAAKRDGYRSRAAYKLEEIADKYGLLKPGDVIVDLGAAPGGWSQIAASRVQATEGRGAVLALDILPFDAIPGVIMFHRDFSERGADEALIEALAGRRPNAVLSDMAAPATGHRQTDHLRIMGLTEEALAFAVQILAPGGAFLAKVFQGGSEKSLLDVLKRDFATVRHLKPKASRAELRRALRAGDRLSRQGLRACRTSRFPQRMTLLGAASGPNFYPPSAGRKYGG